MGLQTIKILVSDILFIINIFKKTSVFDLQDKKRWLYRVKSTRKFFSWVHFTSGILGEGVRITTIKDNCSGNHKRCTILLWKMKIRNCKFNRTPLGFKLYRSQSTKANDKNNCVLYLINVFDQPTRINTTQLIFPDFEI